MANQPLNARELADTELAKTLHAALPQINPLDLPIVSRDRHLKRKERAALTRALFKRLGLKGISVTTPNYSMAKVVEVRIPKRSDYVFDNLGFVVDGDEARTANNDAVKRIEALLLAAFPRNDDRSDSHSDYFDACWSIS